MRWAASAESELHPVGEMGGVQTDEISFRTKPGQSTTYFAPVSESRSMLGTRTTGRSTHRVPCMSQIAHTVSGTDERSARYAVPRTGLGSSMRRPGAVSRPVSLMWRKR